MGGSVPVPWERAEPLGHQSHLSVPSPAPTAPGLGVPSAGAGASRACGHGAAGAVSSQSWHMPTPCPLPGGLSCSGSGASARGSAWQSHVWPGAGARRLLTLPGLFTTEAAGTRAPTAGSSSPGGRGKGSKAAVKMPSPGGCCGQGGRGPAAHSSPEPPEQPTAAVGGGRGTAQPCAAKAEVKHWLPKQHDKAGLPAPARGNRGGPESPPARLRTLGGPKWGKQKGGWGRDKHHCCCSRFCCVLALARCRRG